MKNYANSDEYGKYLEKYEYIFDKAYFLNREEFSLTENLSVLFESYNHSYNTSKNYGYSISCQKIYLLKMGEVIHQLKMVFGRPFFQYIKHSNDNEYFICGNDLLDFSIFNISENKENRFVSEYIINDDTEEICNNEFWYIKNWIYNSQNNLVAINGQDGMNCSTVSICDFTNPDKLPLLFINLSNFVCNKYGDPTCIAYQWAENNELELEVREEETLTVTLNESKVYELLNMQK